MTPRCVLTFHRVVDSREKDHDITWRGLTRVLDEVAAASVAVVPALEHATGPAVVLTFDDGTDDHLRVGEELARLGLRALFFIPTGKIGTPGYLDETELRALGSLGHVLGAHANRHEPLRGLSRAALSFEVQTSRDRLAMLTGDEIRYFAPPGGVGHRFLKQELRRSGFKASRSTKWGLYSSDAERWSVPCIPVTDFTLRRGWVTHVLAHWELPPGMRTAAAVKAALPGRVSRSARSLLHNVGGAR
jgi:peptidoglycan/xylan/chitin deacetylase (PgdA/CDA1 family)